MVKSQPPCLSNTWHVSSQLLSPPANFLFFKQFNVPNTSFISSVGMRQSQVTPDEETAHQDEAEESFNSLMVNIGVERYQTEIHSNGIQKESVSETITIKGSNERKSNYKHSNEEFIQYTTESKTIHIENILEHEEMISPIIQPKNILKNIPANKNVASNQDVLDCKSNQKSKRRVTFHDFGRVMNDEAQAASPIMTGKILKNVSKNIWDENVNMKKVSPKKIKQPKPLKITARKHLDFVGKTVKNPNDSCKSDILPLDKNPLPFLDYSGPKLHSQQTNTTNESGQVAKGTMDQTKILEQFNEVEENVSGKQWAPFDINKNPLPYNGSSGSEEEEDTIKLHVQQAEVHFNAAKESGYFEKRTLDKFDTREREKFDRIEENMLPKPAAKDMNSLFDMLRNEYLQTKKITKPTSKKQNTRRPYNPAHDFYPEQGMDYNMNMEIHVENDDKVDMPTSLKPIKRRRKLDTSVRPVVAKKAPSKRLKKKKLEFECDNIDDPIIDIAVRSANEKSVEAVEDDLMDCNAVSSATHKKVGLGDVTKAIDEFSDKINALQNVFLSCGKRALGDQFESPIVGQIDENEEEPILEIQIDQETFNSALELICSGVHMVSSGANMVSSCVASLASKSY